MFEWEESTFLGLKSLYQKLVTKPQQREQEARQTSLEDLRPSLIFLARMLSGKNLSIFETENAILYTGDRVCLPPRFAAAINPELNRELYEVKTIISALAIRDRWVGNETGIPNYIKSLSHEFPFLLDKILRVEQGLVEGFELWDLLGSAEPPKHSDLKEFSTTSPGEHTTDEVEITTEIEGKGQTDVEVLPDPEDDGHGADAPIHTFEKAECLEETSGLKRKTDDEDELEEHEESLKEVDMKEVIRSQERPRSIYRSDIILDGLSLEIGSAEAAKGIPYPEWDYRKKRYKENWCHVQQSRPTEEDSTWVDKVELKHSVLISQLKKQFATVTSEYLKLKRQPFGSDFDIDAVIDSQVQARSGHTPSEAIYLDRKRDLHDISVVILLDLSFSTDAWVHNMRVLDAITETVYCVGEVIEDSIESISVAGFSSNTRQSCRYEVLKDFHEPWDKTKARFGSLQPQGYTRIGPALRHAQEGLLNQNTSRKVVILVTDGRPCDYDRYEGTYGIRDVRKAIETGKVNGIQTHAFAIEKQATETFPQMFNKDHFDVVQSPRQLMQHMSRLFARLMAS